MYDTDRFYTTLWQKLVADFLVAIPNDPYLRKLDGAFSKGPKNYREIETETYNLAPYYNFKVYRQMESLFKRYRFRDDLYSDNRLEEMTVEKLLATQERILTPRLFTLRSFLVIQEARKYVKKVLGKYNEEDHLALCKFSSRATTGSTLQRSYIDMKLPFRISTSPEHREWFQARYLPTDALLRGLLSGSSYDDVESLQLTNVPKSFKSLRSICPNTTIGSFYSYGLGKLIEKKLAEANYRLNYLPEVHKKLAKESSKTLKLATADLSAASDSFTLELINKIIPRDWFNALKKGRVGHVSIKGRSYYLGSFMTMGIGFTFPLQTLIFYALLYSIRKLSGKRGRISVFGDDLIYPTSMHTYVRCILDDLGFKLNMDKTFVHESFRESCGGDFYCGIDVRPFCPEGEHTCYARNEDFYALVFKTYNGLQARWNLEHELPITKEWLESCVGKDFQFRVPIDYPDYSGFKDSYFSPPVRSLDFTATRFLDAKGTRKNTASAWLEYIPCLKIRPDKRTVVGTQFYYWELLRSNDTRKGSVYDEIFKSISDEQLFSHISKWEKSVEKISYVKKKQIRKKHSKNGKVIRSKVTVWVPTVPRLCKETSFC